MRALVVMLVLLTLGASRFGTATAGTEEPCAGDCSGDGRVAIDELVTLVSIATGRAPLSRCSILLDTPRIEYSQNEDCTTTHQCGAATSGLRRCQRRACTADPDCIDGLCVNRFCYRELGGVRFAHRERATQS